MQDQLYPPASCAPDMVAMHPAYQHIKATAAASGATDASRKEYIALARFIDRVESDRDKYINGLSIENMKENFDDDFDYLVPILERMNVYRREGDRLNIVIKSQTASKKKVRSIYIDNELWELAVAKSKLNGISTSSIIERAMVDYLNV